MHDVLIISNSKRHLVFEPHAMVLLLFNAHKKYEAQKIQSGVSTVSTNLFNHILNSHPREQFSHRFHRAAPLQAPFLLRRRQHQPMWVDFPHAEVYE
jgi:hypothetical protein